jgi:hypothetical protein
MRIRVGRLVTRFLRDQLVRASNTGNGFIFVGLSRIFQQLTCIVSLILLCRHFDKNLTFVKRSNDVLPN